MDNAGKELDKLKHHLERLEKMTQKAQGLISKFDGMNNLSDAFLRRLNSEDRRRPLKDPVYRKLCSIGKNKAALAYQALGHSSDRMACALFVWAERAKQTIEKRQMKEKEYDHYLQTSAEDLAREFFETSVDSYGLRALA